jgi:hypothetical protein
MVAPSVAREEVLKWFHDGRKVGKDFVLVDLCRIDFEVCDRIILNNLSLMSFSMSVILRWIVSRYWLKLRLREAPFRDFWIFQRKVCNSLFQRSTVYCLRPRCAKSFGSDDRLPLRILFLLTTSILFLHFVYADILSPALHSFTPNFGPITSYLEAFFVLPLSSSSGSWISIHSGGEFA